MNKLAVMINGQKAYLIKDDQPLYELQITEFIRLLNSDCSAAYHSPTQGLHCSDFFSRSRLTQPYRPPSAPKTSQAIQTTTISTFPHYRHHEGRTCPRHPLLGSLRPRRSSTH
jgi:hypothetical protein